MNNAPYPLNDVRRITSLRELIDFRAEESTEKIVFSWQNGKTGTMTITYKQLQNQVNQLGTAMFDMGIKDTAAAILGENSYEWLLSFFSVVCGNNIVVPLDKELSAEEIIKLIINSECKVLIYSDTYSDIAEKISESIDIKFINMNEIHTLIEKGRELISSGNNSYVNQKIDIDKTALIVYTSGTTGVSKGVMLSHKNLALDTYSSCSNCFFYGDTVLLLPLHHTFGLVAGVFVTMLYGYMIYINSSLRNMSADLLRAKPQSLFLVPLMVEALYKIIHNMALEKYNVDLSEVKENEEISRAVKGALGGNLDTIISGGAALNTKYIRLFRNLGINLLNGYGITECSPVVAVNRNKYFRDGSVGTVLNECEVRIDDPNENGEGEVCVRGSVIMQGYYKMERETSAALVNGWFHTGDLGHIDSDGFLFITGRKKNLIVLSNGENVSPEELEEKIQNVLLVGEVVVYEKQNKIVTEIFPDTEYAKKNGVKDIQSELNSAVADINKTLPRFKQINSVVIRDTEFEKTTTKKIKRNKIGNIMKNHTVIELVVRYLGGWDNPMKAFTSIIVVGIVAEAMVSIVKNNNLSRFTLRLFFQKIAEYILIGIGNTMDVYIVEGEKSFREIIIMFYASYECLKVLYNASEIGLPIPYKIKKILECIFYNKDKK